MNVSTSAMISGFSCLVLLLANISHPCHAQSKGSYNSAGGSGSDWGNGWTETAFYSQIKGYAAPSKDVKKYLVEYAPPQLDTFGNRCTFSGRVTYVSDKEQVASPVNWFQGVSVFLALEPNATPDWSVAENREQALAESEVMSNEGEFSITFDLRKTKRNPDRALKFQIGVSIAKTKPISKKSRQNVIWRSSDPLVKDSIRLLEIPATTKLAPEIRLINEAYNWPFEDQDGTKLIRAVNTLQALGKAKSIAALKYYSENQSDPFEEDDHIVFWIIRTLFEPVDLEQRIPPPMIWVSSNTDGVKQQAKSWAIGPIEIVDEIPFMLGYQIMGSGVPESTDSHIAWAEKFGVIRAHPLRPTSNPLVAAEKLIRSQKFRMLPGDKRFEISTIRYQALSMLANKELAEDGLGLKDKDWQKLLESNEGSLVWDDKQQQFVSPTNDNR